jgi:hypothetical protein
MRQAMLTFRNSLSETLLNQASNCLDSERFYLWHNTPPEISDRDGIRYGDLNETQLQNFKNLMQLFLSAEGYQKIDEITVMAEGFLNQLRPDFWSTDHYSIDLFGRPDSSGSWGFQLDGHHCIVNFLVHGDNVSIVPAFLGGEPVVGTFDGNDFDIFRDERDVALALYNNLTATEQNMAVSSGSLNMKVGPANSPGQPDPFIGNYDYSAFKTGLKYTDMSSTTQEKLLLLMKEYVYNLQTSFADTWWNDIMTDIDNTYFVWVDNVSTPDAKSQFYYRIFNPYLWVEFSIEDPVGQGIEDWNHVHSITRIPNNPATKNGGDYGIFASIINKNEVQFLAQHLIAASHHGNSQLKLDYTLPERFATDLMLKNPIQPPPSSPFYSTGQ